MGEGRRRLLDQVPDRIRRKHFSIRTEQALRGLDPALEVALQQSVPPLTWRRAEGRGVSDASRGREAGVGFDAEPGQECGPVPVQGGPRGASSLALRHRVGEAAGALPVVLTREEVESILARLSGLWDG
jgi:hypothetical protein